uniref:Nsp1_C domain-containing protein n=1 Tax=Enterobius vermicularis TaxID=51028 RepID=A0A0N4VCR2_ENTVE
LTPLQSKIFRFFERSDCSGCFRLFGGTTQTTTAAVAPTTSETVTTTAPLLFGSTATPAPLFGVGQNITTASPQPSVAAGVVTTAAPLFPSLATPSVPAATATTWSAGLPLQQVSSLPTATAPPTITTTSTTGALYICFRPVTTAAPATVPSLFGFARTQPTTSVSSTVTTSSSSFPPASVIPADSTQRTTTAPAVTAVSIAPSTTVATTTTLGGVVTSTASNVVKLVTKPMQFTQIEQLLNRLTLDVETQERLFMNQVLELNAYDRVLLDYLAQQQSELDAVVTELEKSLGLDDWTEMNPIGLPDPSMATQADIQRQAMYDFSRKYFFYLLSVVLFLCI